MQENNGTAGRIPKDEYRLDLYSILNDVKKQWLSILLLTISAMLLSYVIVSSLSKPQYIARTTIAVHYPGEVPNFNDPMTSDINTAMKYAGESAKGLSTILTRNYLEGAVAKERGTDKISGKINAETVADTNLLMIRDVSDSPTTSLEEMQAIVHYMVESKDDLLGGVEISVVLPPQLFEVPADTSKAVESSIAIGVVVLVLLCTVLGWQMSLKYTVRNSSEVAPKLGIRLLSVIPEEKRTKGSSGLLISDHSVSPGFAEGVQSLAIRLMNEMSGGDKKTLLISSAALGEGKSTVAANIALAMSQMNRKVILADMDFRNPSLAKILNMQENESADLMQFLESGAEDTGSADLNGLIRQVPGTKISAVLNSKAIPTAVDRYSVQIRKCLELLRNRADYVIVDTDSVESVYDTEELASMMDATVIVVREHFAGVQDIEKAIGALSGEGRLLGCVFNNARKNAISADAAESGNGGQYAG